MEIKGLIDISLSDWDGNVCSVIFLPYCNFRCPFCFNAQLVLNPSSLENLDLSEIKRRLIANKPLIDGVTITGGEPTLHEYLPHLCKHLKELRLKVKVDTNGTNPAMIRALIDGKLVDFIAMDIKAPLIYSEYKKAVGALNLSLFKNVKKSVDLLISSNIDYEFRTTVVPSLHTKSSILQIAGDIRGCKKYVLQNFKNDVELLDPSFRSIRPYSIEELQDILREVRTIIPNSKIRGTLTSLGT